MISRKKSCQNFVIKKKKRVVKICFWPIIVSWHKVILFYKLGCIGIWRSQAIGKKELFFLCFNYHI